MTGIRSFILHAKIWKRIKILQIFAKTLFFVFFSCSTEAPLDVGPQLHQIFVQNQTTKMGKDLLKIKMTEIKALNFR